MLTRSRSTTAPASRDSSAFLPTPSPRRHSASEPGRRTPRAEPAPSSERRRRGARAGRSSVIAALRARRPGTTRSSNRRRGAPRSVVVRRIAALVLAACAALLALRPSDPAPASEQITSAAAPAPGSATNGIPLVLPLADPALATVLKVGERVDIYAAYADSPPGLALPGALLLDIHTAETGSLASAGATPIYVVVQITDTHQHLIENLLAATAIAATLSPVDL